MACHSGFFLWVTVWAALSTTFFVSKHGSSYTHGRGWVIALPISRNPILGTLCNTVDTFAVLLQIAPYEKYTPVASCMFCPAYFRG